MPVQSLIDSDCFTFTQKLLVTGDPSKYPLPPGREERVSGCPDVAVYGEDILTSFKFGRLMPLKSLNVPL
jgi:hypothetical protein